MVASQKIVLILLRKRISFARSLITFMRMSTILMKLLDKWLCLMRPERSIALIMSDYLTNFSRCVVALFTILGAVVIICLAIVAVFVLIFGIIAAVTSPIWLGGWLVHNAFGIAGLIIFLFLFWALFIKD